MLLLTELSDRVKALGTLRFLLAIAVVGSHSPYGFQFVEGATAVEGFFIISGFFITLVLCETRSDSTAADTFGSGRCISSVPSRSVPPNDRFRARRSWRPGASIRLDSSSVARKLEPNALSLP